MPKRLRLSAPIKAQLQHVLEDYPGGQLLSEALQNAEDCNAKEFVLLLDLRQHTKVDSAISGPAFVLVDDGTGFGEREWKSYTTLHQSEKRNSPDEIGSYGMGSRSYFHYSDLQLVASRGDYVALDPLEVVDSHGRGGGGWAVPLQGPYNDQNDARIAAEGHRLFELPKSMRGAFDPKERGAMFRLPLRREEDVQREGQTETGLLGKEIKPERAEALLRDWAASAPKMMLFLSNVSKISIYLWAEQARKPACIATVCKEYKLGTPMPRLPPSLKEHARTYESLTQHLLGLGTQTRTEFDTLTMAVVKIAHVDEAGQSTDTNWLIAQRFDACTRELLQALQDGCTAVPIVGIALPVAGSVLGSSGCPFCFLPVGSMTTGLPVHLNGAFRTLPNRRELWMPHTELDGKHAQLAQWNHALLRFAVPRLWLDLLRALTSPELGAHLTSLGFDGGRATMGRVLLASLPDLKLVEPAWLQCAQQVYAHLAREPLLPHPVEPSWVSPVQAVSMCAPTELTEHMPSVLNMYARCPRKAIFDAMGSKYVVLLPEHVHDGCTRLSQLQSQSVEHVARTVIRADREAFTAPQDESAIRTMPVRQLKALALARFQFDGAHEKAALASRLIAETNVHHGVRALLPFLRALLTRAATLSAEEHRAWREALQGIAWVPTSAGGFAELSSAFGPRPRLASAQLDIVTRFSASFCAEMTDTALEAARVWGLKGDLTWADCAVEASDIARSTTMAMTARANWAQRLIEYMTERNHYFVAGGDVQALQKQLGQTAFHPAWEACSQLDGADATRPPQGTLRLSAASALQAESNAAIVWATAARAALHAPFLSYAKLTTAVLIGQIVRLAVIASSDAGLAADVEPHILKAVIKLAQLHPTSAELRSSSDGALLEAPWVPARREDGGDALQLMPPKRVARRLHNELWPRFGRLPDAWCKPAIASILEDACVASQLSCGMLADELHAVHAEHSGEPLSAHSLKLAVGLANELAMNMLGSQSEQTARTPVPVPTVSGRLHPSPTVFINDAPWHAHGSTKHELLHEQISPANGRTLGCSSVREELARLCQVTVEGETFEQSEQLNRRIQGLLEKYNDEKDVFVEHYQNCDDAGAERVLFLLDMSSHKSKKLITPEAAALHGPSLLMASSKPLAENDLLRILRLGDSQKSGSFSKAGRFGLGLNSMYHLSDTPQIFARGLALIVFDPLHRVLGGANGKRYEPAELEKHFPDMLRPFDQITDLGFPTVFRLPLRTTASDFGRAWHVQKALDLMRRFCQAQAQELLLFARSVSKASFAVHSEDKQLQPISEVARQEQVPSSSFMSKLPDSLEEVMALEPAQAREGLENVRILLKTGAQHEEVHWLIAHSLVADAEGLQLIRESYTRKTKPLALLPHGAVALRLSAREGYQGSVAAYMPIGMALGPPLLVHGCFNVDDSRKQVPLPDEKRRIDNNRCAWNANLIKGACAYSYCRIVMECTKLVSQGGMNLDEFFEMLALADRPSINTESTALRDALRAAVWGLLAAGSVPFLPVADSKSKKVRAWLPNCPETMLRSPKLAKSVQDMLLDDGMQLVLLDESLRQFLDQASSQSERGAAQTLAPHALCRFLTEANRAASPAYLKSLHEPSRVYAMLKFVLPEGSTAQGAAQRVNLQLLTHVPLLMLMDKSIAEFGDGTRRYWNDAAPLLPHAKHLLLDEDISKLLRGTSNSIEAAKEACAYLDIHNLTLADLQASKDEIHALELYKREDWLSAVWAFIDSKGADANAFMDWRILPVEHHADARDIRYMKLSEARQTFNLDKIDAQWRDEVRKWLVQSQVSVPLVHVANMIPTGDEHLVDMLSVAADELELNAKTRKDVLRYFSSRRQCSGHVLARLRRMPLFLRARPNVQRGQLAQDSAGPGLRERFVSVDDQGVTYQVLYDYKHAKLKHAGNLQALDLGNVCFLAIPDDNFRSIYHQLGVCSHDTLEFVTKVFPHKLAQVVSGSDEAKATALLSELAAWVVSETDEASKKVVEAVKACPFVPCQDGQRRSAKELTDLSVHVARAFESILQAELPEEQFYRLYKKMLSKLGMKTYLKPAQLLMCAKHLESEGISAPLSADELLPDQLAQQSFHLVEALATNLMHTLNRSEQNKRTPSLDVRAAFQRRILLVHGPPTDAQIVDAVQRLAIDDVRPAFARRLGCCNQATMTAAALPWASCAESGHEAFFLQQNTGLYQSNLQQLANRHSNEFANHVGLAVCATVPAALEHLRRLAICINDGLQGQFRYWRPRGGNGIGSTEKSRLYNEIYPVIQSLDSALVRPSSSLAVPPGFQALPCLPQPISTEKEPSSTEPAPAFFDQIVRMVAPNKLFWRLPKETSKQEQLFTAHHSLSYVRRIATALGVRDLPSVQDWVDCTRDVYTSWVSDEVRISPLPADVDAIAAAVEGVVHASNAEGATGLEMFLLDGADDDDRGIYPSSQLVYADGADLRLKRRCSTFMTNHELRFAHAELVRERYGETLAHHTQLRKLSEILVESVGPSCQPTPADELNPFDQALEHLLRSNEFAAAYAVLTSVLGTVNQACLKSAMQLLSSMNVAFVADLHSTLRSTADASEVEGSRADVDAMFAAHTNTLYIYAGKLGGEETDSLLRQVAESVTSALGKLDSATVITRTPQTSHVVDVLKCWPPDVGPRAIERRLEDMGVRAETQQLERNPGEVVPMSQHAKFDNSLHCSFSNDETVAVETFESDMAHGRCIFAKFRGVARDAAGGATDGGPSLTREYLLWCGDLDDENPSNERLTRHQHMHVYKITRTRAVPLVQLPAPANPTLTAVPPDASIGAVPVAQPGDEFAQLVGTLREMLALPLADCKRACNRLYLAWHPDKCSKPHAARYFGIVNRFAKFAKGGQRDELEAFVASLRPDPLPGAEEAFEHTYREVQPHTWFDEFRREEEERCTRPPQRASSSGAAGPSGVGSPSNSGHSTAFTFRSGSGGASSQQPPKYKDPALGDVEWQTAQSTLVSARVLKENDQYADSVFFSHQVAEHAIKAAMLRTCGVTGDEFRGASGHFLTQLLAQTGLSSPVEQSEVEWLSRAYLAARYPPFPPRGRPTPPAAVYGADEAETAFRIAKAFIDWGRSTEQIESSLASQAAAPANATDEEHARAVNMCDIDE